MQAFAGTALYLFLPENVRLSACILLFLYCFFVQGLPLLVEAAFGCSFSVASNVFAIANLTFTYTNKNNAPL
ncbi:hypothetical protein QUA54_28760 [Microcoleus sp. MOSTC5]|uniref:hypothetical protein n=1 Tax=Microcoleus sp. MOSTC5 TaxID=3055378 RepID=UPI002FD0E27F